jgi:hypothetical protein
LNTVAPPGIVERMQDHVDGQPTTPAFREVYPTLTEQELKEAEANLTRYVEIAFEIHKERRGSQGAAAVDTSAARPIIKERSNRSQKT